MGGGGTDRDHCMTTRSLLHYIAECLYLCCAMADLEVTLSFAMDAVTTCKIKHDNLLVIVGEEVWRGSVPCSFLFHGSWDNFNSPCKLI